MTSTPTSSRSSSRTAAAIAVPPGVHADAIGLSHAEIDAAFQREAQAQQQVAPQSTLSLWEKVHITDPAFTRGFTTQSGFSGTAIAPMYLVRKATEAFGPMGLGWGMELIEERYLDGAPLMIGSDGQVSMRSTVHTARYELWYVLDGKRGSVQQSGSTTMVGRRNGEFFCNEDAAKMTQTDAMTKCLSLLGFGADVHLGLFDDAKYVAGIEAAITSGQLAGVNLQYVGTPAAAPAAAGQQGDQQGTHQAAPLSKRYQAYRARISDGGIADLANARQLIEQDQGLTETERAMLLSLPEMSPKGSGPAPE